MKIPAVTSIALPALLAVSCGRVALVEAPRGPDPSSLPPPFHLMWWSHHAEASESEGSTHLQYSVTGVPQEVLDGLAARVPSSWERVDVAEGPTWKTVLDLATSDGRRQRIAEASFRHPDGRLFILTVGHDEGAASDRRTEVSVHMVELTAAAAARRLADDALPGDETAPVLAVAPQVVAVPAGSSQAQPRRGGSQ